MPNESRNVIAMKPAVTGGILAGPTATPGPTNNSTALNAGFIALGYVGDAGLVESTDRSTDKVKAWGGDVVKVLQTDYSATFTFTLIEAANSTVLTTIYGAANVVTTAATSSTGTLNAVKATSATLPRQSYVFEMKDGNAKVRIYVPQGQITATGDITYSDGEVVGHEVTLEAFFDSTLNAQFVKYIDNAISSTGASL